MQVDQEQIKRQKPLGKVQDLEEKKNLFNSIFFFPDMENWILGQEM